MVVRTFSHVHCGLLAYIYIGLLQYCLTYLCLFLHLKRTTTTKLGRKILTRTKRHILKYKSRKGTTTKGTLRCHSCTVSAVTSVTALTIWQAMSEGRGCMEMAYFTVQLVYLLTLSSRILVLYTTLTPWFWFTRTEGLK